MRPGQLSVGRAQVCPSVPLLCRPAPGIGREEVWRERGTGTWGSDGSCARKAKRGWVCCVLWLPEPAAGHFIKVVMMVVFAGMVAFYFHWVYFSLGETCGM